jgi:hypothetical protein
MATTQSFFNTVQSYAKPFVKAVVAADPVTTARNKFAAQADEQVKLLKEKKDKGFWFVAKDGLIVVNLKNGAAVLKGCSFQVKSAADAVKLIEAAKKSAATGEFDELFKATARKPVVRKAKDAALAAAPASK